MSVWITSDNSPFFPRLHENRRPVGMGVRLSGLTPLVFKWSSGILVHSFTSASVALQAVLEKT